MKAGIKCPKCNSCLNTIWILPKRFYHCWLCTDFYDKVGNDLIIVDVQSILGTSKEELNLILDEYYETQK